MKTTSIFYPHRLFNNGRACRITFHAKHAAVCSALYTMNVSILVILTYSWRIQYNAEHPERLEDVYSGVQIAYVTIIILNVLTICVSLILLRAIYKGKYSLIILWLMGTITFASVEGVCLVCSNALRDHVNKKFDDWSKKEGLLFLIRIILLILPISGVTKFYRSLRRGIIWRKPGTVELKYQLRTGRRSLPSMVEEDDPDDSSADEETKVFDNNSVNRYWRENENDSTDSEYESSSAMV